MRRIGVLMPWDESDPEGKRRYSAFTQALADLGWTDGRKVRMDIRWGGADINRIRSLAQELVGLQPDIVVTAGPGTVAVQRETRTIPIVFTNLGDPVASGVVERLDRPGGNVTGFANVEANLGSKWLELLSEIAPGLRRAAVIFNPDTSPTLTFMLPSLETAARSLNLVLTTAPVHSDVEMETAIVALGREPGDGPLVMPSPWMNEHRAQIILAAARSNKPAVYPFSYFARDGGLLSYGSDQVDIFRRAASYVDRILRGEKPGDLPVQFPVKYEMAVNLKTAKTLGLTVPQSILLRADEVIE
jgi:putative ABC transport system substrate-binding protein